MDPGIQALQDGALDSALGHFKFILRYYPNHPRALPLMGDLSLRMEAPEVGDEYFRRAITLYPETMGATGYLNYGKFLVRAGRAADAISALKKSLAKDDSFSETHYYLGLAYLDGKNLPMANHHAQMAYGRGFPLMDLKKKLMEVGAWEPEVLSQTAPAKRTKQGKRPPQGDH
jgi:predicted Zn-dependent protease